MTGYRLAYPVAYALDANGAPDAGATYDVWQNETTTEVDLFSDRDCLVPAANPIVADASGRFPVRYVDSTQLLTMRFRRSDETGTQSDDDIEPMQGATTGVADGSVTLDKMADLASQRIIMRSTASTGVPEAVLVTALTQETAAQAASDLVMLYDASGAVWKKALTKDLKVTEALIIAVGDETTTITTGTSKVTFRMPYAFTLTAVRANVKTAPSGGVLGVDINEDGVSIFSTVLTIDASEKTSVTAATPAVLSDTSLADDAEITIDVDSVNGSPVGLKIILVGYRT